MWLPDYYLAAGAFFAAMAMLFLGRKYLRREETAKSLHLSHDDEGLAIASGDC